MKKRFESWGRYPKERHTVIPVSSRTELPVLQSGQTMLPFGLGRSYGDSCLNHQNVLLDTGPLSYLLDFDQQTGLLRCEAGISLDEILRVFVPRGWFLPVTPGTRFVTVGGAIANDVHGKNHHCAGAFGQHVLRFGLLRSDNKHLECSPNQNSDLFNATIGGMGLTGLITWAEIKLKAIKNPLIDSETVKFTNLKEFFELSEESEKKYEFSVSWVDCLAKGDSLGRGLFMRGNTNNEIDPLLLKPHRSLSLTFPFEAPSALLNNFTIRAFNCAYYGKQRKREIKKTVHYEPFFYPLDAMLEWNRMYGKRGFFQWQCVVPYGQGSGAIEEIFKLIADSGKGSFLAVLKTFGDIPSPGLMSFPRKGVTLALDFPNDGPPTLELMDRLDQVVCSVKGAIYAAKDARMSPKTFRVSYPRAEEFSKFIDPKFSSSFWRRVTRS
ncbi:MAG: FAD-binding oxidoreductase [SAR324 cluster bacterium]|uniref:FAD-binding oxidoreductase n=1 Tax=SAR324 cluster bacterium TaxID=2024889 RepID=A0A7X9IMC0_9DELT|nr:FAD-binding oxidoreductase [SAR324 cluster bacterium]